MSPHTSTSRLPKKQNKSLSEYKKIIQAYGSWLESMEWDYYCTFTTRYSMSMYSARKAMERLFPALQSYCGATAMFWVAEPFDTKESCHTHALISFSSNQSKKLKYFIKNTWQIVSKGRGSKEYNNTRIYPYKKHLGGNYYVAKYLNRHNSDHDLFL